MTRAPATASAIPGTAPARGSGGADDRAPLRMCLVFNPARALTAYKREWDFYMERGGELWCITGVGPEYHETARGWGLKTHVVPMERYPRPLADLVSLVRMWWFLLRHRFDVIHVSSPKASFLGALGAWLSGQRRIMYLVRGRPYEHATGWRRRVLATCEWLTCRAARRVVPICRELGEALVAEGLCPADKVRVVGSGSSRGVDLERFSRSETIEREARAIRAECGIERDDLVIVCVGWLRQDKGTNELIPAFQGLAEKHPRLHLLMLGNYEPSDPLRPEVVEAIRTHPRIHHLQLRENPVAVFAAGDIVAFPTHREGFGNVAVEGSAMELPVVASDIPGCREAVADGRTGLLVPLGDVAALAGALERLVVDPELRREMGRAGRERVVNEFARELVLSGMMRQMREIAAS